MRKGVTARGARAREQTFGLLNDDHSNIIRPHKVLDRWKRS